MNMTAIQLELPLGLDFARRAHVAEFTRYLDWPLMPLAAPAVRELRRRSDRWSRDLPPQRRRLGRAA